MVPTSLPSHSCHCVHTIVETVGHYGSPHTHRLSLIQTYSNSLFLFLAGAYLVPYLVLLIIIGIPLFFLELAVGQRIRRGSIGVWHYVCPRLGGIGFSSCIVSPVLGVGDTVREAEGPLVDTIEDVIRFTGQSPRPRQGKQERPSAELLTAGVSGPSSPYSTN